MGNQTAKQPHSENGQATAKISKAQMNENTGSMMGSVMRFFGFSTNRIEPEEEPEEEVDANQIRESFVNPMKSILTDQSSGAFVPWSHISKVIAAMEILTREFRANDDEMNEIMLEQCTHLLRESPYTLKLNKLGPSNPEAEAKGAAHSKISMSLRGMDAHSYGKATVEVTNWISKMVNLHLDLPSNLNDLPDTDDAKDDDQVDYDEIYKDLDDDETDDASMVERPSMPHQLRSSVVSSLADDIKVALKDVKSWNWDCFAFFDLAGDFALSIVGVHLLKQTGMLKRLQVNEAVLAKFLHTIQQTYHDEIPYHNSVHAADVCVSLHALMSSRRFSNSATQMNSKHTCELKERLIFRADEILTAYIGALCHDVGHPGFNNAFHMNSESDLAILYNDQSVLENFHIATTYRVLKMAGNDFTTGSRIDRKRMRKLMTHLILHTDMAYHTRVVDHIQMLKETKIVKNEELEFAKQQLVLQERGVTLPQGNRIKLDSAMAKISPRHRKSVSAKSLIGKQSPRTSDRRLSLGAISEENVESSSLIPLVALNKGVSRRPAMSVMDEDQQDSYESKGFDESVEWSESDKHDFLSGLMHACDISNPCKDKRLMLEWSLKLYSEFYNQGDEERKLGLDVSEICDRHNPKRAVASIGFGNFIVKPLFEGLKPFFKICDLALITLDKNTVYWEEKADEDETTSSGMQEEDEDDDDDNE